MLFLVVMGNVFSDLDRPIHLRYDLKVVVYLREESDCIVDIIR